MVTQSSPKEDNGRRKKRTSEGASGVSKKKMIGNEKGTQSPKKEDSGRRKKRTSGGASGVSKKKMIENNKETHPPPKEGNVRRKKRTSEVESGVSKKEITASDKKNETQPARKEDSGMRKKKSAKGARKVSKRSTIDSRRMSGSSFNQGFSDTFLLESIQEEDSLRDSSRGSTYKSQGIGLSKVAVNPIDEGSVASSSSNQLSTNGFEDEYYYDEERAEMDRLAIERLEEHVQLSQRHYKVTKRLMIAAIGMCCIAFGLMAFFIVNPIARTSLKTTVTDLLDNSNG